MFSSMTLRSSFSPAAGDGDCSKENRKSGMCHVQVGLGGNPSVVPLLHVLCGTGTSLA